MMIKRFLGTAFFSSLFCLPIWIPQAEAAGAIVTLDSLRVTDDVVTVNLSTPTRYNAFLVEHSPRLVVDFLNTEVRMKTKVVEGQGNLIKRVRVSQHERSPLMVTRVVFDIVRLTNYEISRSGNSMVFRLVSTGSASTSATKHSAAAVKVPSAKKITHVVDPLELVDEVMYKKGKGIGKDGAEDVEFHTKACDLGDGLSCWSLALMYDYGQGIGRDLAKAGKFYVKACGLDEKFGCRGLGVMYKHGRGIGKDAAKAAEFYTKACDLGEGMSCSDLGDNYMYEKKDAAKAVEFFRKACGLNEKSGCAGLGFMYAHGNRSCATPFDGIGCAGVFGKDEAKAVEFYAKACGRGEGSSCEKLASRYKNGTGIGKDEAMAVNLLKKACGLGLKSACSAVPSR